MDLHNFPADHRFQLAVAIGQLRQRELRALAASLHQAPQSHKTTTSQHLLSLLDLLLQVLFLSVDVFFFLRVSLGTTTNLARVTPCLLENLSVVFLEEHRFGFPWLLLFVLVVDLLSFSSRQASTTIGVTLLEHSQRPWLSHVGKLAPASINKRTFPFFIMTSSVNKPREE